MAQFDFHQFEGLQSELGSLHDATPDELMNALNEHLGSRRESHPKPSGESNSYGSLFPGNALAITLVILVILGLISPFVMLGAAFLGLL